MSIQEHHKKIFREVDMNEVALIYRFGSQNYGTATATSDHDYMVCLLPTAENLVEGTTRTKKSIQVDDMDINFIDVRLFVHNFTIHHVSMTEVLLRQGYWVNPNWVELDKALTITGNGCRRAIGAFMTNKLFTIIKGRGNINPEYGYDVNQLAGAVRMDMVANKMNLLKIPYLEAIKMEKHEVEEYLNYKNNTYKYTKDDAITYINQMEGRAKVKNGKGKDFTELKAILNKLLIKSTTVSAPTELEENMIDGRTIVFAHSFGSTNYGNTTSTSDVDMRYYVLPNDNDLETANMVNKYSDDSHIVDIRLIGKMLYKSNPNTLEMFNAKINHVNGRYKDMWDELQASKYELSTEFPKGFTGAISGMCNQKYNLIKYDKPVDNTNKGYDLRMKYGFDTKAAAHFVRLIKIWTMVDKGVAKYVDLINLEESTIGRALLQELKDIRVNKKGYTKETMLEYFDELFSVIWPDRFNKKKKK